MYMYVKTFISVLVFGGCKLNSWWEDGLPFFFCGAVWQCYEFLTEANVWCDLALCGRGWRIPREGTRFSTWTIYETIMNMSWNLCMRHFIQRSEVHPFIPFMFGECLAKRPWLVWPPCGVAACVTWLPTWHERTKPTHIRHHLQMCEIVNYIEKWVELDNSW